MWGEPALCRLIAAHLHRHAVMEPADVYKLLYQGVLGPEHLVSAADFSLRLRAEYEAVPAAADEPLWEPVRPDGRLGRLNLRPFKACGGDVEWLITAVMDTAAQTWGTREELRTVWHLFVEQCRAGLWGATFEVVAVESFTAWLAERGYPAVHHSAGYRQASRPAYRVVAHKSWQNAPLPFSTL